MTKPLILVADDSKDILQFIEENILIPAGYQVTSVGDGMSALTLAKELEPALILTDHNMPNLTGIELIRRVQRENPHIPVILMTSEGSESLAVDALRAGAVDYLVKPFEDEQLLAAVGRALTERVRLRPASAEGKDDLADEGDLERRLHELETLTLVGRTVTALLELDKVLTTVVEAAVQLTRAEEGSLLLLEEDTGELYMRASKNFDEEFATAFRLPTRDSLAGQVIETGQPVILDKSKPEKIKTSYLVHSLIYVPLRVRGKVIGVLGVDNRNPGHVLTEQDMTVMTAMADYAAIAVDNAQLFTRSEAGRNQLETILRQSGNGVIVVDTEKRMLLINRAAHEALGVEADIIGKPVDECLNEPKMLTLIGSEGKVSRREEIEVSDGRVFNVQATPIEGVGEAIIMHDITHLKNLDRIKSEFVTTVSHDLRSPLTAILGYIELVGRAGDLNEQQNEFIERVRMSVQQITELVTDLLDLGRIEAGFDLAKEKTPLVVLARYALDNLRGIAESKGVVLADGLPKELPLVNGDPIRLRQMIGNLLDNAIKYTPEGGEVRIEGVAEGEQVILRVSDTGAGIPPADQPYLFDKFFRASNVPEEIPGTGLGLTIVKSIVDNHGGRIWVDSKLGEGTTFTVILKAANG